MSEKSYELDPDFEKLVLWRCAMDPKFWGRAGQYLDPERMANPAAAAILHTVRAIAKEVGTSPDSTIFVIQRLKRRVTEGKLTHADVQLVSDVFDSAEDELGGPATSAEILVNELAPIVRRHIQSDAVVAAMDEFSKRGDFSKVRSVLERAAKVGTQDLIGGVQLGAGAFAEIEKIQSVQGLPSGVMELDLALERGLARGELGMYLASSGGGKSQSLAHQAAEGVRRQLFVGFITLELPQHVQLARIFANLTGVEVSQIIENKSSRDEAQRRYKIMEPHIGICDIGEFSPKTTTVRDVLNWITEREDARGRKMDLLVVDYADLLGDPSASKDGNQYQEMGAVYVGLRRDVAIARNMYVWTASQASRGSQDTKKLIDMDNVADSMHKIRASDRVISLNPREDQLLYFVVKNRTGKARLQIGPLVTDFARSRMTPAAAEFDRSWR